MDLSLANSMDFKGYAIMSEIFDGRFSETEYMTTLNAKLASQYPAHIAQLQQMTKSVLSRENLEGLVIHSGQEIKAFLDVNCYPFKANPHFKYWLPIIDIPNSWLWLMVKINQHLFIINRLILA
eukprot:TRINITY_DN9257_c0_g1_i1.p1 TRINITY_DN9257_c0_g1~~TRINITY_DN9257_c0_g1_i1.p1  ORF type:complete len:144 (+),score=7.61 TRINITY_DN9257_c0_g1_i1:63-434(+)